MMKTFSVFLCKPLNIDQVYETRLVEMTRKDGSKLSCCLEDLEWVNTEDFYGKNLQKDADLTWRRIVLEDQSARKSQKPKLFILRQSITYYLDLLSSL